MATVEDGQAESHEGGVGGGGDGGSGDGGGGDRDGGGGGGGSGLGGSGLGGRGARGLVRRFLGDDGGIGGGIITGNGEDAGGTDDGGCGVLPYSRHFPYSMQPTASSLRQSHLRHSISSRTGTGAGDICALLTRDDCEVVDAALACWVWSIRRATTLRATDVAME